MDTTRATYFAGKAAMLIWSSYLLDELAGLRDDALPTCDEVHEPTPGGCSDTRDRPPADPGSRRARSRHSTGRSTSWTIPTDADPATADFVAST